MKIDHNGYNNPKTGKAEMSVNINLSEVEAGWLRSCLLTHKLNVNGSFTGRLFAELLKLNLKDYDKKYPDWKAGNEPKPKFKQIKRGFFI